MVVAEWINHGKDQNKLPSLHRFFISYSLNVNLVDKEIESNQVNTVKEETNFLECSSMRIPFEINKLTNRFGSKDCVFL